MNKIGFIGYGSMARMLIDGFLSSKVITPNQVIVSTRSKEKLEVLSTKWAGIRLAKDNKAVAHESKILFLCVKPLEILPVLVEIKDSLHADTHLVSMAVGVTLGDLQAFFNGRVTKLIPSFASEVQEGISLVCHNDKVQKDDLQTIESLLNSISRVVQIDESDFEAAGDLTSCAPGILTAIFKNFVEAGIRNSHLSSQTAHEMVSASVFGTATLLMKKQLGFSEMIARVATKGGITEEGIKVVDQSLPSVFDELFQKTLEKHNKIKSMIREQVTHLQTKPPGS